MNMVRHSFAGLISLLFLTSGNSAFSASAPAGLLHLTARSQVKPAQPTQEWQRVEKALDWDPRKTAIVVCDMWDTHWCAGASRRVAEMAPRMNEVLKKARQQGVFIIHCPS